MIGGLSLAGRRGVAWFGLVPCGGVAMLWCWWSSPELCSSPLLLPSFSSSALPASSSLLPHRSPGCRRPHPRPASPPSPPPPSRRRVRLVDAAGLHLPSSSVLPLHRCSPCLALADSCRCHSRLRCHLSHPLLDAVTRHSPSSLDPSWTTRAPQVLQTPTHSTSSPPLLLSSPLPPPNPPSTPTTPPPSHPLPPPPPAAERTSTRMRSSIGSPSTTRAPSSLLPLPTPPHPPSCLHRRDERGGRGEGEEEEVGGG